MSEILHEQQHPMYSEYRRGGIRSERLHSLVWAAILIWAGLAFIAENIGLFDHLSIAGAQSQHIGAWPVIFLGAGLIVMVEVVARLMIPDLQCEASGRLVFAVILLGIGLGSLFGWSIVWPMVLIAIGVSILLGGYLRRM